MSRKYLITGGLGFLGGALGRALALRGDAVRVLDDGSRGDATRLGEAHARVEIVAADVRDRAAVRDAVRGVDAVCHFASVNGTRFFYEMPARVLEVSVKGMLNVLDACVEEGVGELYVASSSEVYQTPPRVPTDENVPLTVPDPYNPRFSYCGGKILSELLAIHCGRERLRRVVIFRPHNVYGPAMGWEHVIPEFVLRFRRLRGERSGSVSLPIQGTGQETRAFIFVEDFTRALLRVMEAGEHLGIYNIGTMEEVTIASVACEVARYFQREVVVVPGELRPGSTPRRCPDTAKLRALGFEPKAPFREGLRITARWYDENAERGPEG